MEFMFKEEEIVEGEIVKSKLKKDAIQLEITAYCKLHHDTAPSNILLGYLVLHQNLTKTC